MPLCIAKLFLWKKFDERMAQDETTRKGTKKHERRVNEDE